MPDVIPEGKISLLDWFNCDDPDHLRAWKYMEEGDSWPEDFLPENIVFPSMWRSSLRAEMADRWIAARLAVDYVNRIP